MFFVVVVLFSWKIRKIKYKINFGICAIVKLSPRFERNIEKHKYTPSSPSLKFEK